MKKNVTKLNEKDENQVAGGYIVRDSSGKFRDSSKSDWSYNYRYDIYCNFCDKKLEGKSVMQIKGGRHACLDCYKKLSKINKNIDEMDFTDNNYYLNK